MINESASQKDATTRRNAISDWQALIDKAKMTKHKKLHRINCSIISLGIAQIHQESPAKCPKKNLMLLPV